MSDLRFAVFGAGYWSRFQIAAWREVSGARLVALYNRTVAKAEKLAAEFNVPAVYGDPEELLRREKLDFIDIITEVEAHTPLVMLAARHQVPIICQKPMAPDYATASQMVDACRAAGVPLMIHENFRWQSTLRALKGVLAAGSIGRPFRARIQFVHSLPAIWQNQPQLKTLPHLAVSDLGSHLLDLARFYFGEAQSLYCQTYRTRPDIAGEDVASVVLRLGDVICTCEMSYSTRTEWEHFPETFVYVEGTDGTIEVAPDYWIRVTTKEGTQARRHAPPAYRWADPAYLAAHASIVPCNAHLLHALQTGEAAETSGADNLKTARLVFAAYDSAERNEVIRL